MIGDDEEDEMDKAINKETELADFIGILNSFTFLNVTRATSAKDFGERIDRKTISNNVILICDKDLETKINAKIKENKKRE
jgi:hypothetical protein